jgi:hypothetical protein
LNYWPNPNPDTGGEFLERIRGVKTVYSLRCGTRPRQCSDLLGKLAKLLRQATDGYFDE